MVCISSDNDTPSGDTLSQGKVLYISPLNCTTINGGVNSSYSTVGIVQYRPASVLYVSYEHFVRRLRRHFLTPDLLQLHSGHIFDGRAF